MEMSTNVVLCKPFVIKITAFTIHIEVQQDSCSSVENNLHVFEEVSVFLSLNINTEGDDRAEGLRALLCMHT